MPTTKQRLVIYNTLTLEKDRHRIHTTETVYDSDLASLMDMVASLDMKQKVKHSVRKSIPKQSHVVMTLNKFDMCLILMFQGHRDKLILDSNFYAILKILAHLSASILLCMWIQYSTRKENVSIILMYHKGNLSLRKSYILHHKKYIQNNSWYSVYV